MAALTEHTYAKIGKSGDVTVGLVENERVLVTETRAPIVNLRDNCYVRTNFYINQSRPYVGDHKLTRYLYLSFSDWFFSIVLHRYTLLPYTEEKQLKLEREKKRSLLPSLLPSLPPSLLDGQTYKQLDLEFK